ncbi:MAG: mechanosensitive ion channel [Planctomycetes bacterium]|nr:mechanosensitive ion channel [Planctomycetota bacterium]
MRLRLSRIAAVILPAVVTGLHIVALIELEPLLIYFGFDIRDQALIILQRIIETGMGLSLAWLGCALIDAFFWHMLVEARTGQPAPRLLVAIMRVLIVALAISIIVAQVFDQPLTGVLVSSGVVGIVLGFALQRTINDLFSGIALNVERAFRIGDWIEVDGAVGRVVEINWRATHLVRLDQVTVVLPNSYIAERQLLNYDKPQHHFRAGLKIGLEYGVPVGDAKRVLLGAVRAAEGVLESPSPDVLLYEFGADGVLYELRFFISSYARKHEVIDLVAMSVSRHLYQAGMSVPFPKRDVYFAQMPPREIDRRKDRAELLSRIDLFTGLTGDEIHRLVQGLKERHYNGAQHVVHQGDAGSTLFLVVDGLLEVRVDANGRPRKVAQLEPGQFFGEMSMLTGEPRSASVVAVTDATLYELDRDVLTPILQARPEFAQTLSRVLAERRSHTQTRLQQFDTPAAVDARRTLAADFLKRIQGFFGLNESPR